MSVVQPAVTSGHESSEGYSKTYVMMRSKSVILLVRSTWGDFHLFIVFLNSFHIGLNSFRYFISDKSPGVLLGPGMLKTTTSADLSEKHFL